MATEVSIGDLGLQWRLFGKNLEIWSPNSLLLWSKSPKTWYLNLNLKLSMSPLHESSDESLTSYTHAYLSEYAQPS